ncbi:MAG: type IV pilus modification protein PilV [Pseudohongiellaceae bacterium]
MRFVNSHSRESGATLLEVLISLMILAGGMLGMSALLTSSLKINQSSNFRTQATLYSQDIIERMRSNISATEAGDYDDPSAILTASCLTPAGCPAAAMAAHDVAEWETLVQAGLPSGSATVCIDASAIDGTPASPACDGAGSLYAVKIWWDDDRDGVAEQRFIATFQP